MTFAEVKDALSGYSYRELEDNPDTRIVKFFRGGQTVVPGGIAKPGSGGRTEHQNYDCVFSKSSGELIDWRKYKD